MQKRLYRGRYAGLTSVTIAGLMGCTEKTARRYLRLLATVRRGEWNITLEDLGEIIHRFRELEDTQHFYGCRANAAKRDACVLPGGMLRYYAELLT